MNEICPFEFEGNQVRVALVDGEPVFVAADILSAMDLDRKALERVDREEKGVRNFHTLGGPQDLTVVTEAGLYLLVFGSHKPSAKRFKFWIAREVLPSIRKTGTYSAMKAPDLQDFGQLAKMFTLAAETANALVAANKLITENQPKVDFFERFAKADGLHPLMMLGKIYGCPPKKLIKRLTVEGYLYRLGPGRSLVPQQDFLDRGFFTVKEREIDGKARQQTYVTAKGVQWLAGKLGFVTQHSLFH